MFNEYSRQDFFLLAVLLLFSIEALFQFCGTKGTPPTKLTPLNQISTPFFNQAQVQLLAAEFGTFAQVQREGRESLDGNTRVHSMPIITGDGFRALADEIIDTSSIDLAWCARLGAELEPDEALILYVKGELARGFFSSGCFDAAPAPHIVLVTHNTDDDCPGNDLSTSYLDHPRLTAWFAQNCDRKHVRLFCIPIGLENRMWGPPAAGGSHGSMPELILGMMLARAPAYPAAGAVAAAEGKPHTWAFFSRGTHPSRGELMDALIAAPQPWLSLPKNNERLHPHELYREMMQHAAIVCPRGNGLDSHRIWEALYLGRLAITLHSPLDELWLELPVLLLNSWDELLTSESLIKFAVYNFSQHANALNVHKLFMPYWACKIGKAAGRGGEFCTSKGLVRVLAKGRKQINAWGTKTASV